MPDAHSERAFGAAPADRLEAFLTARAFGFGATRTAIRRYGFEAHGAIWCCALQHLCLLRARSLTESLANLTIQRQHSSLEHRDAHDGNELVCRGAYIELFAVHTLVQVVNVGVQLG